MIKMITYTKGFDPYTETNPERVYKWLAETYMYRHQGSKDIRRITYTQKYDGYNHITFYISNGTRVEVSVPRGVEL